MQRTCTSVVLGAFLILAVTGARADDSAALIALDKQWGESVMKGNTTVAAKLLSDKVVSVSEKGVRGKQAELADSSPAPAGSRYEPTDYKVTFIDSDTAVMTHGTKGAEAHYSLHVWSRKGDTWEIIATSTTPVAK